MAVSAQLQVWDSELEQWVPYNPAEHQEQLVELIADAVGEAMPDSPETGLAKDVVLQQVRDRLPAGGAATSAKQDTAATLLTNLLTELSQKLEPGDLSQLATASNQTTASSRLQAIVDALAGVLNVSGRPAQGAVALTVGADAVTPGRWLWVNPTTDGQAVIKFTNDSTLTITYAANQPFTLLAAIKQVVSATGTATFANLA